MQFFVFFQNLSIGVSTEGGLSPGVDLTNGRFYLFDLRKALDIPCELAKILSSNFHLL